ncbi:MAG: hypothetical protein QXF45_04470 [Candidatus Caldarchaeum sp.]|uniref:Ribonuclease P protein component 4 n=1 Tax=Caldiarchaeum subterraneum TaxID=311458 RepID=A0A7C5Y506_CALS0
MKTGKQQVKVLKLVEKTLRFAEEFYSQNPERAVEAVKLAMRICQKKRVRLPPKLKRKFCRKCGTPFVGPSTVSVRVRPRPTPHVVVKCKVCGFMRRFLIRKKAKTMGFR